MRDRDREALERLKILTTGLLDTIRSAPLLKGVDWSQLQVRLDGPGKELFESEDAGLVVRADVVMATLDKLCDGKFQGCSCNH